MRRALPIAAFWFLYFGGLGIFFPFYTLYLRENAGLSGTQVGVVLAMMPLVGIVAQPVWGHLADRTGARSAILTLLTVATALAYLVLGRLEHFPALVAGTAALAVFGTAIGPLSMSIAFAAVRGAGPHAFGLLRVWGTVGYLITVAGYPWLLHRLAPPTADGAEPGLASLFPATAGLFLLAALIGPLLPRSGAAALRASPGQWRELLPRPAVRRLLLFTFAAFVCLQGPIGLFPLFIRARGGDLATVGNMWVVMILLEIPLVALAGTGLRRLGARGLMAAGLIAGGVRWTVCALTGDLAVLYVMQLLHGVTVAGLLLGGPLYLEAVVPPALRSTAQALLATAGMAIGSIVSNTATGWLMQHVGPDAPFLLGGLAALVLGACTFWILPSTD
ncbi:MAG: MFS transporter [Candidatus Binatia bacterium]